MSIGRRAAIVSALAALGATRLQAEHGAVAQVGAALFPRVIFSGPSDVDALALTIDDGPDPDTTPAVLEALAASGIKATCFLLGDRARAAPAVVERIVAGGHEVGHHMDRDEMTALLSDAALETGMADTAAFLRQFAPVRFLRPGWGVPTARIVDAAQGHGLRVVVGNVAPMDTSALQRRVAGRWLQANLRPGAILTLHDGGARGAATAQLIGPLSHEARGLGLRCVTLTELVDGSGS